MNENLPLRERKIDLFFAVLFVTFAVTSGISDAVPTLGIEMTADSANPIVRANYWYAHDADPLFMHAPVWMRIVTGLSTFVYGPFYLVLAYCLVKGRNWIQLPAVIYGTMISTITGIIVTGVELFGEPQYQTQNAVKFFSFNWPYIFMPIVLIIRMRRPMPFTRRF